MTDFTRALAPHLTKAYDFSRYRHVIDVGGGNGVLARTILGLNPYAKGVVYDRAEVIEQTRVILEAEGLAPRCTAEAGDFFKSVPEGGDLYTLKSIVHDWNDEEAIRILSNVRRAIGPGGRLLLIETVVGAGSSPIPALSDVNMLVMCGGRERTEEEFRTVMGRSGFRMTRTVRTDTPMFLIEEIGRAVV